MKRDRLGHLLLRLARFSCIAAQHGETYERSVQVTSCPRQGLVRQRRAFQSDPGRSLEDDVMPGRQSRSRAFVRHVRTCFLSTQRRLMVCLSASHRSSNDELGLNCARPDAHPAREPEASREHSSCRSTTKNNPIEFTFRRSARVLDSPELKAEMFGQSSIVVRARLSGGLHCVTIRTPNNNEIKDRYLP